MDDLKEVVLLEKFGICPRCGRLLYMLESKYTLYGLTETGRYPNKVIKTDSDLTAACICGFKCPMIQTVEGTMPRDYWKTKKYQEESIDKSHTIIGYIDGKKG